MRADKQSTEESGSRDRANRIQAAKQRRHNAIKAGAASESGRRSVGLQTILQAQDLHYPGQAGESAREKHRKHHLPFDIDAGIVGRPLIFANRANPIAQRRTPEKDEDDHCQRHGDNQPPVQSSTGKERRIANRQRQTRQLRGGDQPSRFRNVVDARGRRVKQDAVQQIIHHLHRDLIEHDCAKDFIDIKIGFEESSQAAIQSPSQKSAQQRQTDDEKIKSAWRFGKFGRHAHITQRQRNGCASQGAGDHLPFAADIDHAAAKGNRNADSDKQNRRRLDQGFGRGVFSADRALKHSGISVQWISAQSSEQDRSDNQSQRQRDNHRRKIDQPLKARDQRPS